MLLILPKSNDAVVPVLRAEDTAEAERRRAESLALLDKGIVALEAELAAAQRRRPPDVDAALEAQNRLAARRAERERLAASPVAAPERLGAEEEAVFLPDLSEPPEAAALLDFDKRAGALAVNAARKAEAEARAAKDREARDAWAARRRAHAGAAEEDLTPEVLRDLVFVLAREAGLL